MKDMIRQLYDDFLYRKETIRVEGNTLFEEYTDRNQLDQPNLNAYGLFLFHYAVNKQ